MSKAIPSKTNRSIVEQKTLSMPAGYSDVRVGIVELLNAARQAAARNAAFAERADGYPASPQRRHLRRHVASRLPRPWRQRERQSLLGGAPPLKVAPKVAHALPRT